MTIFQASTNNSSIHNVCFSVSAAAGFSVWVFFLRDFSIWHSHWPVSSSYSAIQVYRHTEI